MSVDVGIKGLRLSAFGAKHGRNINTARLTFGLGNSTRPCGESWETANHTAMRISSDRNLSNA